MTGKIGVGVIGAGFVGGQHVEALRRIPGVQVRAISASTSASAAAAASRLGVERSTADVSQIIEDPEISVVHVCTPNFLHRDAALAALAAGKHVICEKPLALNAAEARELADAAAVSDRLTVLCHNYRFYPMVAELRSIVGEGGLGAVHAVRGHYLQDWLLMPADANWRLDPAKGGRSRAMADIGSHWIDLAEILLGSRVSAVFADVRTVIPRRQLGSFRTFAQDGQRGDRAPSGGEADWYDVATEDAAALLLRFDGGRVAGQLSVSQVAAGHKNDLEISIDGAQGSATWQQERPDELWIGHREGSSELRRRSPGPGAGGRLAQLPAGHPEGWADAVRNLFAAAYDVIRGDQTPDNLPIPLPTFADGLRHQLTIEAALESAARGAWVEVPATGAGTPDDGPDAEVSR